MSSVMDRRLADAATGFVRASINDYAWSRLLHRGLVEVVGYKPGRLRQTLTITARGRAELRKGSGA